MPTGPPRSDLGDMCFSGCLLNWLAGQVDSDQEYVTKLDNDVWTNVFTRSDRRRRLATRVINIDFDNAENQDPDNTFLGDPTTRTVRCTCS
jgi:hypothetical protein